jgi:hypothetical protein
MGFGASTAEELAGRREAKDRIFGERDLKNDTFVGKRVKKERHIGWNGIKKKDTSSELKRERERRDKRRD